MKAIKHLFAYLGIAAVILLGSLPAVAADQAAESAKIGGQQGEEKLPVKPCVDEPERVILGSNGRGHI